MAPNGDEDVLLRSVALQNAQSILLARQRAEEELVRAKEALQLKTQELEEKERRLRFVMDSMPQKIFGARPNGDVDYFNPQWTEFTGLSFEQIRDWGWTQFIHPDDLAENVRVWQQSIDTGEPFQFEHRFRRADGEYRWHISRAVALKDAGGKVQMWVGSNTDVQNIKQADEQLRLSEERFRSLVTATISIIWTTDATGQFVTEQPSWTAYTGQTWDELKGFGWVHALHADDRERVWEMWEAASQARTLYKSDGRLWHADSQAYRHFEARGVPVFNADGSLREWVGKCIDVHDQRQAEKRIYDLLTELREGDRRKDEFLATLAHELRGPLAPLCNMLEIMKRADGSGDLLQQARDTMDRQLGQMVRLVDDLLDVGRITRNKLELRKEQVELASIIHQSVEVCRPLAESAKHKVTVSLPPEPVYLHADPVRLAQVFSNLLNNSCKYTEPGGRIWLTAERQGSDVVVKVKDTGIGIPADKLAIVFEMFSQVQSALERSQGGLGIGLTLVKRLVEMHGGSVDLTSEGLGRGSEFIVRLPLSVEGLKVHNQFDPTGTPQAAGRRILIVDDNQDSAASLAMLMNISGHETAMACDGLEAVEAAESFRPDLVLLDIGLPKLNGHEVARQIREQPWGKDMVLVALTGWGQEEDRRKSKGAGFDQHMVKPVDYAALMKLLAELLPKLA